MGAPFFIQYLAENWENVLKIYHNGECSKCRGALEIIQELGIPHEVRWYLAEPLSGEELTALLHKLHMHAKQLVRMGEPLFAEQYEGKQLTDQQWLQILIDHPALMQRPILELEDRAIVAGPPDKLYDFLGITPK
jgi:arsenate reductase